MDRVLSHETVQGTAEMSEVRAVRCQNSGDRKILLLYCTPPDVPCCAVACMGSAAVGMARRRSARREAPDFWTRCWRFAA